MPKKQTKTKQQPGAGRWLNPLHYWPASLVWAIDVFTKNWAAGLFGGVATLVPDVLRIRLVRNAGGYFGLADPRWDGGGFPFWSTVVALMLLLIMALRLGKPNGARRVGFSLMIGGAFGNFGDRLIHGHVVDFIEILTFPIFNLADVALFLGIILVMVDILREPSSSGETHASDPT